MRTGFFSDLHGDLVALQRALESLADVDAVVFLGDAVGGPRDLECLQILRQRNIPCIVGNHDLDPADVKALPPEFRQGLAELPRTHVGDGFLGIHSHYETVGDYLKFLYIRSEDEAQALFDRFPEQRLLLIGHTHLPWLHVRRDDRREGLAVDASQRFQLEEEARYICNVGMTRTCVVIYDSQTGGLEFRLFEPPVDRLAPRKTVVRSDFAMDVDLSDRPPSRKSWRFW